jgi:hypothetical protein
MFRPRLLRDYPPATLDAIRSSVAALLRHQDILPTDLYVKLCLFREDLTTAINSSPRPAPAFTPHPAPTRRPPQQRM